MPQLDTMDISNEPKKYLVYGPSLGGKTLLACSVAAKYKVLYIDGENGTPVLFNLPAEYRKNIFVQKVIDNKDTPSLIKTSLMLTEGKPVQVCDAHGIVMNKRPTITPCSECTKAYNDKFKESPEAAKASGILNDWCLNDMNPAEWIIVIDSLTQVSSSANATVTKKLKDNFDGVEGEFEEFKHWRSQGKFLEKLLDYVQTARYNCIVISHEEGIKQADGSEKIVPAGGTSNFARKVARYFNGSIYCATKNKKHIIISTTTGDTRVLAGTRGNIEIDPSTIETRTAGMLALFDDSTGTPSNTTTQVAKPKGATLTSRTGGLASLRGRVAPK